EARLAYRLPPASKRAWRFHRSRRSGYNAGLSSSRFCTMSTPRLLAQLEECLHQVLPDARLAPCSLPGLPELQLWLLDPVNLDRAFASEETRRLLEQPPYWGFCWGSGMALARWVLDNPQQVRGRRVLDFGSGSGVVALACSAVGASRSIACDLDQGAQLARDRKSTRLNSSHVKISYAVFCLKKKN